METKKELCNMEVIPFDHGNPNCYKLVSMETTPMIKANELRIGNWVYDPFSKSFIQVVNITETGINEGWDGSMDMGYVLSQQAIGEEDIEPIPLTPEILEKADCSYIGIDDWYSNFEPTWIMRNEDDGFTLIIEGKEFRKIKYVHEYQNLYFALTGSELEINL
jgi:hypothetical protein